MTPEERQRLKEKELAHLRELQRLKRLARQAKRQNRLNKALDNITGALDQVMDPGDSYVAELELENARADARLEMALGAQDTSPKPEARAPTSESRPIESKPPEPEPTVKTIGTHLRTPAAEDGSKPE